MLFVIVFSFSFGRLEQSFPEDIIKSRREQSLRFAQCASSNILPYSRRLFQATRSTGTGLNEKDKILRALFKAANKSLASESSS